MQGLSWRSYRGASHHKNWKIIRACVQSVLTYGTEIWAENLHSLERAEPMMVRWMCGVFLKYRKRSEVLYSLLGEHSECGWDGDDRVSACRNVEVEGRSVGAWAGRLGECVKDDMKVLGLQPEWAIIRDMWRGFISGKHLTLAEHGRNESFKNKNDDDFRSWSLAKIWEMNFRIIYSKDFWTQRENEQFHFINEINFIH